MFKSIPTLAAAVVFAAIQLAAGTAFAETITVGGVTQGPNGGSTTYVDTRYRIRDQHGEPVANGRTRPTEGPRDGENADERPSRADVDLPPGRYTIEVWYTDPRGRPYKGTQRIRVRRGKHNTILVAVEPQSDESVLLDRLDEIIDRRNTLQILRGRAEDISDQAAVERYQARLDENLARGQQISLRIQDIRDRAAREARAARRQAEEEEVNSRPLSERSEDEILDRIFDIGWNRLGVVKMLRDRARAIGDRAAVERYQNRVDELTEERARLQDELDSRRADNEGTGTEDNEKRRTGTDDKVGAETAEKKRAALEEQQSRLEQSRASQLAQIASFTAAFLKQRAALLAELPAAIRANLENTGGTHLAGYASVKYTRLKIQIESQAALNENSEVPAALVALDNLYVRMGKYFTAVNDTNAAIAQTQKDIAHTITDEKDYATGGGDGGGGDGGGGDGGGGN